MLKGFTTRRQFLSRSVQIGTVAAVGLPLSECDDKDTPKPITSKLRLQASWSNDAEFIGYFVAVDNKFYEDRGISLEYLSGGQTIIPEGTLLNGVADLALTTPETTASLISRDKVPLKIIGAQYQRNPIGIVSLRKKPINAPKDLVGKKLAVPQVNLLTVQAMLKLNNLDPTSIDIVPYQYDPEPLIQGAVDATVDFVTNVPYEIERRGEQAVFFLLYDYGFKIFNDTVVVTQETLSKRRSELISWLIASRRGWTENFQDPKRYPAKFIQKGSWFDGNNRTQENEEDYNERQKALIESTHGPFWMSSDSIGDNIESLKQIGINITRDVFVPDLIEEAEEAEKKIK
jgi:ABC-type nitrate/sulfonate/bicarbonate transport system substrate-binding protein